MTEKQLLKGDFWGVREKGGGGPMKKAMNGGAAHRAAELCSQLNECAALLCILMTPVNDAAVTCQDSFSCSFQALLLTTPSARCDTHVT